MKTVFEIEQWRVGAAVEFGDPSEPVCQIFLRFVENAPDAHDDLLAWWDGDHFVIGFGEGRWLPIQIDADEARVNDEGQLEAFRIKEISRGVWALYPSLNIQGFIHAFVIIYGVPSPAPWVSRIVVVQGF